MNGPTPWQELTAVMYACLSEAQTQLCQVVDPTSEDVRAVGISLFIEARRSGVTMAQLPVDCRFQHRVRELQVELGNPAAYRRLLHEHQVESSHDIEDPAHMTAFVEALYEEIHANQTEELNGSTQH